MDGNKDDRHAFSEWLYPLNEPGLENYMQTNPEPPNRQGFYQSIPAQRPFPTE
jgi:hypothetical protein